MDTGALSPGDSVRVRASHPPGHCRTPFYIRGLSGHIERAVGRFGNPELLGYGLGASPKPMLYRVRFRLADLWPEYPSAADDTIDIEIYEHWLEPVEDAARA
jgi:nitrile hydratase